MHWIVKKHGWGIALLSGLGAVLAAACWLWYVHTHPDLRTRVSHIRRGMTVQQVYEIVGCPPGVYRTKAGTPRTQCYNGPHYDEWLFDDGDVMVTFMLGLSCPDTGIRDGGTCFEVFYRDPDESRWQPVAPGLIDRLTARLGF